MTKSQTSGVLRGIGVIEYSERLRETRRNYESISFIHSSLDDMPLTPDEFRVYCHLLRRADKESVAYPGYQSIGEHCFGHQNLKPESMRNKAIRAMKTLVKFNMVMKVQRSSESGANSTNIYVITLPAEWEKPTLTGDGGDVTSPGGLSDITRGGDVTSPKGTPIEGTPIEGTKPFASDDAKKGKKKKSLSNWNRLVQGVTWCVHGHADFSMLPNDGPLGTGVILRESKIIKDAGYTHEDIWRWWREIWKGRWAFTESGGEIRRPTPVQVRMGIPAIRADKPVMGDYISSAIEEIKAESEQIKNMSDDEREELRKYREDVSRRFKPEEEMSEEELDALMESVGATRKDD